MYQISKDQEKQNKWEKYVEINMADGYSKAVIDATISVCKLLDKGHSPIHAEENGMKGHGLTGFMAGAVANGVVSFHPRGNEFKIFWNRLHGIKDRNTKGVVNSAIMTFKKK